MLKNRIKAAFKVLSERYPLFGPLLWLGTLQYFIVQPIAASAWTNPPYNWGRNTISDLAAPVCGVYNGRMVCSPLHSLMSASFIVLGICIIVGAIIMYLEFKENDISRLGFSLMSLNGIGTLLVGLFAETTNTGLHGAGAVMSFVLGNASLSLLGTQLGLPKAFRYYSIVSTFIGITGFVLFALGQNLMLGHGGMERVAAYPQSIWLIIFGAYTLKARILKPRSVRI